MFKLGNVLRRYLSRLLTANSKSGSITVLWGWWDRGNLNNQQRTWAKRNAMLERLIRFWGTRNIETFRVQQRSANTGPRPGACPWRNSYRAQIGLKVTGTTDIRNKLLVPLTTTISACRSSLLRQSKSRYLMESEQCMQ